MYYDLSFESPFSRPTIIDDVYISFGPYFRFSFKRVCGACVFGSCRAPLCACIRRLVDKSSKTFRI